MKQYEVDLLVKKITQEMKLPINLIEKCQRHSIMSSKIRNARLTFYLIYYKLFFF